MRIIIIILSILLSVTGCRGQSNTKQQAETTEGNVTVVESIEQQPDADRGGSGLPHIDRAFISLFPDMVFGEYIKEGKRIPGEMAGRYLSDLLIPEEAVEGYLSDENEEYEWMYAIGKIIDSNGLDLFFCTYESENIHGSDNHIGFSRYLLPFRNGIPLTKSEDPQQRLVLTTDYHYIGEGGETIFESYFDTDTTVVSRLWASESESATGYNTPLVSTHEYRWKIGKNGEKEIIEITKKEYSSPFYDRSFLKEQNWAGFEENERKPYPARNDRWELWVNSLDYNDLALIRPIDVYFHIEKADGELIPVFETCDAAGELIDSYTVGQPRDNKPAAKNYSARGEILKCPVIIKTSDGDLELLPDGKFLLETTEN